MPGPDTVEQLSWIIQGGHYYRCAGRVFNPPNEGACTDTCKVLRAIIKNLGDCPGGGLCEGTGVIKWCPSIPDKCLGCEEYPCPDCTGK